MAGKVAGLGEDARRQPRIAALRHEVGIVQVA
jgi:hypothetical protein